jgi:hypothetical protein
MMNLLDDAVQIGRLRTSADLLRFRKSLHVLKGVVTDIGAGSDQIGAVLLGQFFGHLACEYPERLLSLPTSRAFATRLSNADLAEVMLSWPWAAARFWLGQ